MSVMSQRFVLLLKVAISLWAPAWPGCRLEARGGMASRYCFTNGKLATFSHLASGEPSRKAFWLRSGLGILKADSAVG